MAINTNVAMSSQIRKTSNPLYIASNWRNTVEDHMLLLKELSEIHRVLPHDAHRFHQDLAAYLFHIGVPEHMHWITLRLNDFLYNWDFTENTEFLLLPSEEIVTNLLSDYRAVFG